MRHQFRPCEPKGMLGVINSSLIDSKARNYILSHGAIQPSHLALFLLYNSVMSAIPNDRDHYCCVSGFHSSIGGNVSLPGQTYVIAEFEGRNQTAFGGVADVSVIWHELAEWANNPSSTNPAPAWGFIGQAGTFCEVDLEVADPLTGTLASPVSAFGFTYHFQEIAFLSWFFGDNPSQGAGGKYSSNGTFTGYARPCPPGGTF
jgi:hypothetical protein